MQELRQSVDVKRRVCFVHGMWSTPGVWDAWRAAFEAEGYPCIAVTLPGHGEREGNRDLGGLGLTQYVEAVLAEIAGTERPILIGHSMGGLIAQLVAARAPVAAIVLVNSAAPAPVFPLRPKMLPGLVRHFLNWNLRHVSFRLSDWEADYLLLGGLAPPTRAAVRATLVAESGLIPYELGFGSLNVSRTNYVDRTEITCAMLALAGGRDRIVPIDVSRAMARHYGRAMTFREFPDRAHWLLGEPQYAERIRDVLGWLADNVPVATPS